MAPTPAVFGPRSWKPLLGAVLVFAVTVGLAQAVRDGLAQPVPSPLRGVLDLRSWDFSQKMEVPLGGTWEFVPEELVTLDRFAAPSASVVHRAVPDTRFLSPGGFFAGTGGGTYHLRVLLPKTGMTLGLRFSAVWVAYEVEVNGSVLTRIGNPSTTATREVPSTGTTFLLLDSLDSMDLVVRVSNHQVRWGGLALAPTLGTWETLSQAKRMDDITVLFLVGGIGGTALFALFFLGFRARDPVFVSFAVFALLVVVRALVTGDRLLILLVPGLSFDTFMRIHYLSLFLFLPAGVVFFASFFHDEVTLAQFLTVLGISLLPVPLVPWAPLPLISWEVIGFGLIYLGTILYGYWTICLKPSLRGRSESWPSLIGGSFLLGLVLFNVRYEVASATMESEFPWGLLAFVIVQALLLAHRSTTAFHQAERLTTELKQANQALAAETREAEEARAQLEEALAEKEILLKEVHHRVKNSLQIVLSIIGMETRRATDDAVKQAYRGVRERIRAISLVHDRLYGIGSDNQLNLRDYLFDLTSKLGESYGEKPVVLNAPLNSLLLPVDFCLDLGLIVTELVINSYRHGQVGLSGTVQVTLAQEGNGSPRIIVSDDGPGFPADFDIESNPSAGFRIIVSLVKGRNGRIKVDRGPGARVEVSFGTFLLA